MLFSGCAPKSQPDSSNDPSPILPTPSFEKSPAASPPGETVLEASPSVSPSEEANVTVEELGIQIEERYGVKLYWDQDSVEYGWSQHPVSDFDALRSCLTLLDEQLALYPENFFQQFKSMGYPMEIMLTDLIINEEDEMADGRSDANDTKTLVVLVVSEEMLGADYSSASNYTRFQYVLHHEIGHTIYQHVCDFDNYETFDIYGEFLDFLPPDYSVGGTFIMDEEYQAYIPENDIDNVYFCDSYAMSNLAENMASLFGYSMCPTPPWTFESPHVQDQLRYFFNAIRKVYGSSDWPAETYWERVLHD